MAPTRETDEYLEYDGEGFTYRVLKVDPPRFVVTFDYAHPKYADKPRTWLEIKALFDALEGL